ncbi:MAG TPA: transglycosylase domain-containing protein [Actinoplanes sp.]|nr:transglycosylase domain-containing protein [Actinoplanes sp.]
MTLTGTPSAAPASVPTRRHTRGLVIGAAVALLLATGGAIGGTVYFDSVTVAESRVGYPVVSYDALPGPVAQTFVAAVDPDFFEDDAALLTRRYAVLAAGADSESGLRTWVMARKLDSEYTRTEILERYLGRADFGRGAVGLVAAAQTYFQKPATELTVPEAAVLAVQLMPGSPEPTAGWNQVLDTMVDRGWLTRTDRRSFTHPG